MDVEIPLDSRDYWTVQVKREIVRDANRSLLLFAFLPSVGSYISQADLIGNVSRMTLNWISDPPALCLPTTRIIAYTAPPGLYSAWGWTQALCMLSNHSTNWAPSRGGQTPFDCLIWQSFGDTEASGSLSSKTARATSWDCLKKFVYSLALYRSLLSLKESSKRLSLWRKTGVRRQWE